MPELKGVKKKYVNGILVDKENEDVIYSDAAHVYLGKKDNDKYTSVTQLIHNYTQPFNEKFWASYKACEAVLDPSIFKRLKQILLKTKRWNDSYLEDYAIDPKIFEEKRKEILLEYENKRNAACTRGTEIHAIQENMFYKNDEKIKKYIGGGKFDIRKGYYCLDLDRAVYPEFLVSYAFDDYLKVAGQIDLLIKDGNEISITDWKTNRKIDLESYFDGSTKKRQMMKFPLDNIQDCNFYHYSLQLSLYAYLLQKINPKFKIKNLEIVHFDHDGNETIYKCDYLKEDVARMLLHYRRDQKIKSELDLDKPIEF